MEVVNLKTAITLRICISTGNPDEKPKEHAFTTKAIRGNRTSHPGIIPQGNERVSYIVRSFHTDSETSPWLDISLPHMGGPQHIQLLWSNVLSTQITE